MEKEISAELSSKEIQGLKEALTQVLYQNEMLLGWVKGAVVTVDREGLVLSANDISLNFLGYSEEELLGRQYHDTFHHTLEDGSEYPWDFCPVFAAIEDGSSHHVTGDIFWKSDGSNFSADYIVSPIRDSNNNISGATLIFRNLTEQKLQETKRIHGMKLESIGELSAGIAHEINTPIQFIGSNIDFFRESFEDIITLLEKFNELKEQFCSSSDNATLCREIEAFEEKADIEYLKEETPKALDQTIEGVERVSELVLGLKGFAHSSDSSSKVASDINEIIRNTLVVSKNTYKYVATVDLDLGDLPAVKLLRGDIGQVILNLIVNAAQAIEGNKKETGEFGTIAISSRVENDSVIITIEDTGGGIPELVKTRIFDPFFTTKEVGQGSGQGLAIARSIVHEKHGGELSFESKEGVGTSFFVKLPIG